MAVVAVCIAYIQLTVTQCGIFIEYTVFQNYVADYAFVSCYLAEFSLRSNQFAVFVYNQFAVCCIECAVAVYEERYSAVFICSTYGQVVFCVQCVGLDVVCTGNVAFFVDGYLSKFSGFRSDFAVVAVIIASYYTACCYTAACPDSAFAATDVHKCVSIISCKINIVFQLNLNLGTIIADVNVLVTTEVNSFTGSYFRCFAAVSGQIPALVCVLCYFADFLQLLFCCSLTFAVSKASISSSFIAKSAYSCSSAIHDNTAIYSAAYCYTASCPDSAFATADAYPSVRIISCKINIVFQVNIIFLATVRIIFWSYSNVVTCGNSTVFECFCWRISSHRRSHTCTGHNTCCNQHCQQLFGRAAFTAMIFCDFGDNNICVACLTPNYFEYFVHQ